MSQHLDLLQRAAIRGTPRGIDRVVADAQGCLRRRQRRGIGMVAGVALAAAAFLAMGLPGEDSITAVASSQDGDVVALVPDPDRFTLVAGGEPETLDAPASRRGNLTIYQHVDKDGSVAAAAAIAVVNDDRDQSTLLDVVPLDDGTVEGEKGIYSLGHDDRTTNGLVVVERSTGLHTIRVAGRHLDVPTTVAILESVELTAAGEITEIELPDGLPTTPTYDGPDISRFGVLPAVSTSGHYRALDTGQDLTIITIRDDSLLPPETVAWYLDGTVSADAAIPTVIGEDLGSHVAYWRLDTRSAVKVSSQEPLTTGLIHRIQASGQPVDAAAWARFIEDSTAPPDVATTTTVP